MAFRTVTVGPVWTLSESQPGPWGSGQPGRKAATGRGVVPERPARPRHGSSPWLRPGPLAGTTLRGFDPFLARGARTGRQRAAQAGTSTGPTEALCPCAPGPSTAGSSGCAPRPHALCRPSSPGPGKGNRTPMSPSLSRALEKVAWFGLRLRSGLACRCPEARPARESPASRGVEGLAVLALAGSPCGPSLLPGSQMGLLAGTPPAAARLEDAPQPPGATPRVRAGIQGLGCSHAAWPPRRGQRDCWRGAPCLGRPSQPSETHEWAAGGAPHRAPSLGAPVSWARRD